MTKKELIKYIGKILIKENSEYKWMFKLINFNKHKMKATQGMDIFPKPRAYRSESHFNDAFDEALALNDTRTPTKEELNLYRKYTRELILLGTNVSDYGRK